MSEVEAQVAASAPEPAPRLQNQSKAQPTGPFPGLRPFRSEEASIFFGREHQCAALVELLENGNVLLIHGTSGCGKSSLVGAGLLPALRRDYRGAGQVLRDATFRPSSGPYEGLARVLEEALRAPAECAVSPQQPADAGREGLAPVEIPVAEPGDAADVSYWGEKLLHDADLIKTIEARLDEIKADGLCLVIDQFEEIFSWARDRRESDVELLIAFLAAVRDAQTDRVFVLLTMRSDFLGACGRYPVLTELFNKSQYLLPVLDVAEIARAIVEPARMFGGAIEPALLEALLRIATTGTDPLPVVQHALKRMYNIETRQPGSHWCLTLADLDTVSESSNPLSTHADKIAAEIEKNNVPAQQALQWFFRALFDVEKTGEAVRRPRDFDQLAAVIGLTGEEATCLTREIIDAFSKEGANLLTVSSSYPQRVDISHEALLRQWARIAGGDQEQNNWKRREIEDGQLWHSFASRFRDDRLSARSLEVASSFFNRMRAAPERARRYLGEDANIADVRRSNEWQRIETLISKSLRRQWLFHAAWGAAIVVLIGVGYYFFSQIQLTAKQVQLDKATAANIAQQKKLDTIFAESTGASLQSEQVDAGAAKILDEVADSRFDRSGYIWIGDGDGSIATLQTIDGTAKVARSKISAGKCYAPRYLLALRSGMPDPLNRSALRIGSVRVAQRVCALEGPQEAIASNQWWLRVATVTVYIHINSRRSHSLDRIETALTEQHYLLPGTESRKVDAGLYEVRYCFAEDKSAAISLARYLTQQLSGPIFSTRNISNFERCPSAKPGYVEVWIDTESLGWGSLDTSQTDTKTPHVERKFMQ